MPLAAGGCGTCSVGASRCIPVYRAVDASDGRAYRCPAKSRADAAPSTQERGMNMKHRARASAIKAALALLLA
ncbi:MAG TPA: hypothetical protein PLG77_11885, partial [Burkholderiaceae bacterium]|nr:hypothetical protein [Burkholderiaceae bacterium]